jgi:translation elongation factor EF-Tu-like GTPase
MSRQNNEYWDPQAEIMRGMREDREIAETRKSEIKKLISGKNFTEDEAEYYYRLREISNLSHDDRRATAAKKGMEKIEKREMTPDKAYAEAQNWMSVESIFNL